MSFQEFGKFEEPEGTEGAEGAEGIQEFEGFQNLDDEVTSYAAEVRARLADLPAADSAELLEDLEDHLREVAAEDAGTLRERLGAPATYARELRQAAGLPEPGERAAGGAAADRARLFSVAGLALRARAARGSARSRASGVEQRLRGTEAGRQVLDFLPSLRPAWWVFRAWVLVRLLEAWTGDTDVWSGYSLIPRVGASRLIGFIALAAAIPLSVYLGRRQTFDEVWQRRAQVTGEWALGVFAFGILVAGITGPDAHDDGSGRGPYQIAYTPQNYSASALNENGAPVTNLYVYDKDGKLLDGVFVYDQDGQPITVAGPGEPHNNGDIDGGSWIDADGRLVTNRFPRQLLAMQWNNGDGRPRYVAVPPPNVAPPKGVHQPSAGATSNPDSPSPTPGATSATSPPPSATPAQGSPTASAPPGNPAKPGATG